MSATSARGVVIGSAVGIGIVTIGRDLSKGNAPTPTALIGTGILAVGLTGLATVAPKVAAPLAVLSLTAVVLTSGPAVLSKIGFGKGLSSVVSKPSDVPASTSVASADHVQPNADHSNTPGSTLPGMAPSSPVGAGGHGSPVQGRFPIIGYPYQGTHTLGNWESDNAIDIACPVGTPLLAIFDGTIGTQFGSLTNAATSRFAGLRLHLVHDGNTEAYYAHLSRFAAGIKPGVRVRAGQVIGYSGSASGVAHLHLGIKPPDSPFNYYAKG